MGISGLLPLLKSITVHTHIKHSAHQTIGVDAYVWLHRGAFTCAQDLATGKHTTKYVDYAMHRVKMLQHFGIVPYIVFDGDYLPSKAKTETERAARREENTKCGRQALAAGNKKAAQDFFQKAIDVTPAMALRFIQALQAAHIDYVVAPYEADAQLAYLDKLNIIDGVITEDSDLLVFGCKKVFYKLNEFGECKEILKSNMGNNDDLRLEGWNEDMFRYMAILSGCDYLESLPGMGLKTAHRIVRRYRTLDQVLKGLRTEYGMKVPEDYEEKFMLANDTFVHQMVFCPEKKEMVHWNQPTCKLDDLTLRMVGMKLDDSLARGISVGSVDPITKKAIDLEQGRPALRQTKSLPAPSNNASIDQFLIARPLQVRDINCAATPKRHQLRQTPREVAHAKKLKLFESSPDKLHETPSGKENKLEKFFSSHAPIKKKAIEDVDEDLLAAIEASKAEEKQRLDFEGFQNPIAFDVAPTRTTELTSQFFTPRPVSLASLPAVSQQIERTDACIGLPTPPDSQSTQENHIRSWHETFSHTPETPVQPSLFSTSLHRLGGQVMRRASTSIPKVRQRTPFNPQAASASQPIMRFMR